jgi:arylsulfatase
MAGITELATGFPGYTGDIPQENGFLSEMLGEQGYSTFAIGKWHLIPEGQRHMGASKEQWPLGRGFERFYGFLGGEANQWEPSLVHDNHQVEPPNSPEEGYHFTDDITNQAIEYITDLKNTSPDKPFFMNYCPLAGHAPHHVPEKWIDKYEGEFDMGWDEARKRIFERQKEIGIIPESTDLPPRDPDVPKWETLSEDEQRLYARMMEVYAGYLEHADHQIGRLLDYLERIGELDNTITVLVSDNGASPDGRESGTVNEHFVFNMVPEDLETSLDAIDDLGGPETYNHYPWGWAWAGNTPMRRWKRESYRGGTTDPMVIHWPDGVEASGELRDQYTHAIDIVPTILDALDVEAPEEIDGVTQSPIEGSSFLDSFGDPDAPDPNNTQYYEMLGTRGIYHDGCKAVCPWPG